LDLVENIGGIYNNMPDGKKIRTRIKVQMK